MSEPLTLKLVMLKGPRAGETFEFQPHTVVRIGRVTRGNTKGYKNNLIVKDGGVSTEHISIHFDSGRWFVQDRGSSNGTILNDANLTPNTPFGLRHQDVVKIGELTSFSVLIGISGGAATSRRTTRKNAKAVADDQGLKCGISKESEVTIGEEVEVSAAAEVLDRPRRGRSRKAQGLKSEAVDSTVGDSNSVVKASPRRTRGKKKEGSSVVSDLVPPKVAEETGFNLEIAIEGKKARAGTRRAKKKLLEEEALSNAQVNVADNNEKEQTSNIEQLDGTGVGGNMETVDGLILGEDSGVKVATDKEKADGSKSGEEAQIEAPADKGNVEEVTLDEETQVDTENVKASNLSEGGRVDVAAGSDNVDRLSPGEENSKGAVSVSCFNVNERNVDAAKGSSSKVQGEPDLEKMTLKEWFDYLEVHLPKQIIDETEELIENMRQKAIRVHEYKLQQMKGKESVG